MLTIHPYLLDCLGKLGPCEVHKLCQFGHCQSSVYVHDGYQMVEFPKIPNLPVLNQDVDVESYSFFCFSCFEVSTSIGTAVTFLDWALILKTTFLVMTFNLIHSEVICIAVMT